MRTKPVLVLVTFLLVGGEFLGGTLARPDVFAAGPAPLQANTPQPEVSPFRVGGKPPAPVLNIAHRGARAFAPENTIQSFKKAIELGCHMIELDVHHSKDRKLIVVHDDDLVRCSDVKKRFPGRKTYFVSDFTADEILTLDAGSWFVEALNGPRDGRDGYLRDLTDEEEAEIHHQSCPGVVHQRQSADPHPFRGAQMGEGEQGVRQYRAQDHPSPVSRPHG